MNDAREPYECRFCFFLAVFAGAGDEGRVGDDVGGADEATAEPSRRPGERSGSRRRLEEGVGDES
jgi:hypothetical protein